MFNQLNKSELVHFHARIDRRRCRLTSATVHSQPPSDYCLDPNASLSSKCGNVNLGESGACPITGAQPCSPKGHVLANDSLCALDDKDETYKCVASKKDLEIQKHGKKKKKKSGRRGRGSESSMSTAPSLLALTAHQVLLIVVCVAAGIMVIV